jgi:hypothetical protein
MEQNIIVYYPKIEDDGVVHAEPVTTPYTYSFSDEEAASLDIDGLLARIWRDFNHVDGTEPIQDMEIRSSMVGDIYAILPSGITPIARYFIVDMIGFMEITEKGKDIWLSTPCASRGYFSPFCEKVMPSEIIRSKQPQESK